LYLATSITTLKKKPNPATDTLAQNKKRKEYVVKQIGFSLWNGPNHTKHSTTIYYYNSDKNCHHSVNTSSILPKPFGKVAKIIRCSHNRFEKSFGNIPIKI